MRPISSRHTKLKADPLAEDTLEMWVFGWAIKQLRKPKRGSISRDELAEVIAMSHMGRDWSKLLEYGRDWWRQSADAVFERFEVRRKS